MILFKGVFLPTQDAPPLSDSAVWVGSIPRWATCAKLSLLRPRPLLCAAAVVRRLLHSSIPMRQSPLFALSRPTIPIGPTRLRRTHRRCPAQHAAGRHYTSQCEYPGAGPIAVARGPDPIKRNPRKTQSRASQSTWQCHPWDMRARDWRNRKHEEPVLRCDWDLRFSFPQGSRCLLHSDALALSWVDGSGRTRRSTGSGARGACSLGADR